MGEKRGRCSVQVGDDVGFREASEGDCFARKRLAMTEREKMLGFAMLNPTRFLHGGWGEMEMSHARSS